MNISLIIQMVAETFPDRIAVTSGQESLTYRQLHERAIRLSNRLREAGCDRLAYLDTANMALPVALFASAFAGVPFVPLNYRLANEELERLLHRVGNATLISPPVYTADLQIPRVIEVMQPTQAANCAETEAIESSVEIAPDAVAIELFTSGTTGEPKAAILRHENLMAYILGSVEFGSADETDASIVAVPPYHIAGIAAVLSATYSARRLIQLPDFSAELWVDLAAQHQISSAFLVPTMLSRIVDFLATTPRSNDLKNLRAIAYGGGKMPVPTISKAMELLPHVEFTNAYGLTETSSTICLLGPEEHRDAISSKDESTRRRLASVGKPLPGIEVQVRDTDDRELGADETGRIFVRGEQVAGEYRQQGRLTDEQGWFDTRDIGYIDTGGYLFLDGRLDDVIVRGGENISPGEIEAVLIEHPVVCDVAVVAIESAEWGEAVAAAVVCNRQDEGLAEELKHCVKKKLRSSRVPEVIRFVDELPYTETGKLLRRQVREDFANRAKE